MKTRKALFVIFILLILILSNGYSQNKKTVEGNRWRAGLTVQYASNFQNLNISYGGYTYALGGFTGKGVNIFGGYKLHKYLSLELEAGVMINSFNRSYSTGETFIGRFNKFYLHPSLKFLYPIVKRDYRTVNIFLGGGIGFNGSGRLYLEDRYGPYRDIVYARYDPMIAPFGIVGAELLFGNSNIVAGFKYQDGNFNATKYYDSANPFANLKTAPTEIKKLSAKGLGFSIGFIQEF